MARMFNAWRQGFNMSQNMYGHKNKALQAIWEAKVKDVRKEIQRAFTIWRAKHKFDQLREKRIRNLLLKAHNNRVSQGFNVWLRTLQEQDNQMRLHVLARTFAENQLKMITYSELKV